MSPVMLESIRSRQIGQVGSSWTVLGGMEVRRGMRPEDGVLGTGGMGGFV